MSEELKLLPCPFCGGKCEIDPDGEEFAKMGRGYSIDCRKCNFHFWSFHSETPAEITKRFNTREPPELPPIPEPVEVEGKVG